MATARILGQGLFDCFERDLVDADGQPVNAEISAVVWDGRHLVVASDKNVPGADRSPVFALDLDGERPLPGTRRYYTAELIRTAEKYEDFALTVAGDHLIATTGFDRVADEDSAMDRYNRLLVWPVDRPDAPRIVSRTVRDGVESSLTLRTALADALGAPYFKIEGLATVPDRDGGDDVLLFGIREVGRDHEDFDYVSRVVGVGYRMDGDALVLTGLPEIVYTFDAGAHPEVRFAVGLSSLEYDPSHDGLYMTTSFEVEDDDGAARIGGYLWWISRSDFDAGRAPTLVRAEHGGAFEFANKAEGVAVLGGSRLFIVYDPDRDMTLDSDFSRRRREPHEAPYTVLAVD